MAVLLEAHGPAKFRGGCCCCCLSACISGNESSASVDAPCALGASLPLTGHVKPSSLHSPGSCLPPAPLLPTKSAGPSETVPHFRGQTKPDVNRRMHLHEDVSGSRQERLLSWLSPRSRAFPSLSQAQVDLTMYPSPSQAEHISFSTLNSSGFYLCRISYFLPAPLLFILFRLGLGHPELMAVEPSASGGWRSERLPGPAGSGLHH